MLHNVIQQVNAEDLPAEEFRFVEAQHTIYKLAKSIDRDETLKTQLEAASSPETFVAISNENGYNFTIADLQTALQFVVQDTELNIDEFDDCELSEEELEMVAGGTARRAAMTNNSYWHDTGILVDGQCFHLLQQSQEMRQALIPALKYMEQWEFLGDSKVKVTDLDGQNDGRTSFIINNITYNGAITDTTLNQASDSTYEIFT